MKAHFLNPFVSSVFDIVSQTISENPTKGKVALINNQRYKAQDVVIVVGVTGVLTGQVVISLAIQTAKNIAAVMLMEESVNELDEISQSALAEMANMITANSTIGLSDAGYECDITPPSVITGNSIEITCQEGIKTILLPYETSLGNIEIFLSMIETKELGIKQDDVFDVEVN